MSILKQDVGPTNTGTLAVAGITNFAGERVFSNFVGTGNFVSGGVKVGTALAIDSFMSGTLAEGTALGVGVDGVEDLILAVMGQADGMSGMSIGGNRQRGVM